MPKRSPYQRAQRAAETVRIQEIEAASWASPPADAARAFELEGSRG